MTKSNNWIIEVVLGVWATLALFTSSTTASTCAISPNGYYQPPTPSGPFVSGLPPQNGFTYIKKPATLTCEELAQAHQLCVARINQYRAGNLVFSNGAVDPTLGNPPALQYASGMDKCHSEISMGDFALMGTCGAGAHKNAWSCQGFGRAWAQNLCCPRSLSSTGTFQSLLSAMYGCLQQMWDEGIDPATGVNGHWENMRNPSYNYASCGFAFGTSGSSTYVLMTQNFGGSYSGVTSPTGSPPGTSPPVTQSPTRQPTTRSPTKVPTTKSPTLMPTTRSPTGTPTTESPTFPPSSKAPTPAPTRFPTRRPTRFPTRYPTRRRRVG